MNRFDPARTRVQPAAMFEGAMHAAQEARAMREHAHDMRLGLWQEKLRTQRWWMNAGRDKSLDLALDAAVSVACASRANIQTLTRNRRGLALSAQRGFTATFLDYFEYVDDAGCACGLALTSGRPVTVPDVLSSPVFAHTDALDVLLDADVRSVVSLPLIVKQERLVGMLSVHYHQPHDYGAAELIRLAKLANTVAALIEC